MMLLLFMINKLVRHCSTLVLLSCERDEDFCNERIGIFPNKNYNNVFRASSKLEKIHIYIYIYR